MTDKKFFIKNVTELQKVYAEFWGKEIIQQTPELFTHELLKDRTGRCPDQYPCVVTIGESELSEPNDIIYDVKNIEYEI